jgi:hypothetical protein
LWKSISTQRHARRYESSSAIALSEGDARESLMAWRLKPDQPTRCVVRQASNAIVLLILIVVIAVVATPLLPGDGSPSAATERSTGVFRLATNRTSHMAAPPGRHAGEWAMLLVGSALVVVGAALRRPDSARTSALGRESATARRPHRPQRAGAHPGHSRIEPHLHGRVTASRTFPGRQP